MYQGGYTGKVLRVNLTEQNSKVEELPEEMAKNFVGLKRINDQQK